MKQTFKIVADYVKMNSIKVCENTSSQRAEVLNRILNILTTKYGVTVCDNGEILGMSARVLAAFYTDMVDSGKKITTLNYYVCMINPFLNWAGKLGLFVDCTETQVHNICTVLSVGRIPSPETIPESERVNKYLTHEQAQALLHSTTGYNLERTSAIVALILYSGLRVSEVCSLTLGSVLDGKHGEIYVKRKGGKYCTALVGEPAYKYLDAYLKTRDLSDHSQPLFMTQKGKPCSRNQIYRMLRLVQERAGAATGAHALRHSFISEVDKTGGAAVARDLANQRSLRITNIYDHTTTEQRREAIDKIAW